MPARIVKPVKELQGITQEVWEPSGTKNAKDQLGLKADKEMTKYGQILY